MHTDPVTGRVHVQFSEKKASFYQDLQTHLRQFAGLKSISHCLSVEAIHQLSVPPPHPTHISSRGLHGDERSEIDYANLYEKEKWKTAVKDQMATKWKLPDSFDMLNCELLSCLEPSGPAYTKLRVHNDIISPHERWDRYQEELLTFAHDSAADINEYRENIQHADDTKGFEEMMAVIQQNINALDKLPLIDSKGVVIGTHHPTDTELIAWLCNSLTNPNIMANKAGIALDKATTFKQAVEDLRTVYKQFPSWDNEYSNPIQKKLAAANFKPAGYQEKWKEPATWKKVEKTLDMECWTCGKTGHRAVNCRSKDCTKCGMIFKDDSERKSHMCHVRLGKHTTSNNYGKGKAKRISDDALGSQGDSQSSKAYRLLPKNELERQLQIHVAQSSPKGTTPGHVSLSDVVASSKSA